jgi:hypothetical protein
LPTQELPPNFHYSAPNFPLLQAVHQPAVPSAVLQLGSVPAMVAQPALYEASLNRGREIMSKNCQDSTNQARNSAWQGLEAFSQQQLGKPAVMCNPNDVVVYLESTYNKQHGRQRAADGSCPAALVG